MNLMDYSLLVGIHDVERAQEELLEESMENEENGVEEDDDSGGSGGNREPATASPPDSPNYVAGPPFFTGELDAAYEKFGYKSAEGEYEGCRTINPHWLTLLRPEQNSQYFSDDIGKI